MVKKLVFRTCVWFIIALARIRFPIDQSLMTVIRKRYDNDTVRLVRKFEKVDKQLRKAELDLTFLEKCQELGVIPNFLLFRVSNDHLRESVTYKRCCRSLLAEEVKQKRSMIHLHRQELVTVKDELKATMNVIDYTHVVSCMLQVNDKFIKTRKEIQDKKLLRLVGGKGSNKGNDPKKVIHNLSDYVLSELEESILVKGLNHSVAPRKLNYADYCLPFELLFKSIKYTRNISASNLDFIQARMKNIALTSFNEFNDSSNSFSNLSKDERECLKNLAAKDDLVIQKSDKGNSIVILNKIDYTNRVKDLLSDTTKFKVVNIKSGKEIRHIINQEVRFHKVLEKLRKQKKISQQEYEKLNPIGSRPGILYGLSKVHKPLVNGLPKIRPILSAIGTAGYNLAKFLTPILSPVANGPYTVSNNFVFNKEVLNQDASLIMGSLDVDALFTSIPLDETINICVEELFKDKILVNNLSKVDFKELLSLATKESLFIFDGVYYYQTDGVAMGSPLGPILANSFMSYYEQIWLNECPIEFKPKFYRRYVDDIFVLFEKPEHLALFKEYLNSKHVNINFTSENEVEGKLPFLDILINRNSGHLVTSVYRKATFTGVYTHFQSFLPSVYKFGLLSTLLFRYFSICSSYALFHLEVRKFKEIFLRNGYPIGLIDSCIKKFLEKIFKKKDTLYTVPKKEFRIVLPYLGTLSGKTQKQFQNLFQKLIPWGKINIVFKTQSRISHYFRFKDTLPTELMSHLIYHFTCPSCNAEYIGETMRHSKVRWCEHLGISCFTENPVVGIITPVKDHIKEKKCKATLDNFKIIGREENYGLLLIKESLFIKRFKTVLNTKIKTTELFLF